MSNEIDDLIAKVAADPALRQRVRKASVDELVKIAEEQGVKVSRGDIQSTIARQGSNAAKSERSAATQSFLANLSDWSG